MGDMGTRHNLEGGRERIKEEMPLPKPLSPSLIMLLHGYYLVIQIWWSGALYSVGLV